MAINPAASSSLIEFNFEIPFLEKINTFYVAKFNLEKFKSSIRNFSEDTHNSYKNMIFDFGELTKIITFCSLMKVCLEKRFKLNTLIGELFPHFSCGYKENLRVVDMLNGNGYFGRFSPAQFLESLNLKSRPGLLGSRYAKKVVFNQLCRVPLQNEKGSSDNMNFLVIDQIIELLSFVSLERYFQSFLYEHLGESGQFIGFLNIPRFSRVASNKIDPALKNKILEKKFIQSAKDCAVLGGLVGFYGAIGVADSIVKFLMWFLRSLQTSENPFYEIFNKAKAYLGSDWLFFDTYLDMPYLADHNGNAVIFDMSKGNGIVSLCDLRVGLSKEELKWIRELCFEILVAGPNL